MINLWPFSSKKAASNSAVEYTALIELLDLSPMKKWIVFGQAPIKAFLHIALLVMSTASVLVYSGQWTSYIESSSRNWCNFFYPPSCQASDCQPYNLEMIGGCYLYSSNDVYTALQSAVTNYYSINYTSIAEYQFPLRANGLHEPYAMLEITSQVHPNSMNELQKDTYPVTPTNLGPLETSNLTSYLYTVIEMKLILELEDEFEVDYFEGCYKWSIRMYYSTKAKGNFRVTNEASILDKCNGTSLKRAGSESTYIVINLIMCVTSSIWLVLLIKDIGQSYNVMKLAQQVVDTGDIYPMLLQGIEEKVEPVKPILSVDHDRVMSQDQVNQIISLLNPASDDVGQQTPVKGREKDDEESSPTSRIDKASTSSKIVVNGVKESNKKAKTKKRKRRRKRDESMKSSSVVVVADDDEVEPRESSKMTRPSGQSIRTRYNRNTMSTKRRGMTADDVELEHSIHYLFAPTSYSDDEEDDTDVEKSMSSPDIKKRDDKPFADAAEPIDLAAISQSALRDDDDDYDVMDVTKLELPSSWKKISTDVKLRFFNSWSICMIPAAAFALTSSAIRLNPLSKAPLPYSLLSRLDAFTILLLWINLLSYMRFSSRLYSIVIILQGSIRSVGRVLLQAMPLFIGYAVIGVIIYGPFVPQFGNLDYSFQTLFAVMNGDIIHNVIWDLQAIYPIGSMFYVVSFYFFFNYIILRCCLAVVSEMLVFIHVYSDIHKTRMTWRAQRSSGLDAQTGVESKQALLMDPAHSIDSFFSTGSETELPADDVMFFELLDLVFTRYKNVYADYIEAGTGNAATEVKIRESVASFRSMRTASQAKSAAGASAHSSKHLSGIDAASSSGWGNFSSYSIPIDRLQSRGHRVASIPEDEDEVHRQLREMAFASAISPSLGGKLVTSRRLDESLRTSTSSKNDGSHDRSDGRQSSTRASLLSNIFDWEDKDD